jgi:hypothetical protein
VIQNFSYILAEQAVNDTAAFLTFVLINEAHGSWVTCDASRQDVDHAARNGIDSLHCHMPPTDFLFDGFTGRFTIKQTWSCSDLKPRK